MHLRRLASALLLCFCASATAAPAFDYTDLTGKQQRLEDYRGKWVVVNYWATWCPPCLEELPELVLFHENHKDKDAVVIGVDYESLDRKKLAKFVDDYFLTYPVVPDGENVRPIGAVPGLPTTYIIDPNGQLVARRVGGTTSEQLEQLIKNGTAKTAAR